MRIMYYSNAQNHNEMYYSNAQYHYEMYYFNAQSRNDPWTGVWTNHPGLIFLAPHGNTHLTDYTDTYIQTLQSCFDVHWNVYINWDIEIGYRSYFGLG